MREMRYCWIGLWVMLVATVAWGQSNRATLNASLNVSTLRPGDKAVATVVLDIAPGYHAQSHRPSSQQYIALEVKPAESAAVTFGEPVYPVGTDETYPGLGQLNVYEGRTVISVPVTVKSDAKP